MVSAHPGEAPQCGTPQRFHFVAIETAKCGLYAGGFVDLKRVSQHQRVERVREVNQTTHIADMMPAIGPLCGKPTVVERPDLSPGPDECLAPLRPLVVRQELGRTGVYGACDGIVATPPRHDHPQAPGFCAGH